MPDGSNAPGAPLASASAQADAQNRALRGLLLGSAPRLRKNLGNFTVGGTPGQTSRIKLFNVGITTRLLMDVNATFDIGTATASLSRKGPFNLMNRVKVTDFDGTDHINASGYQLWVWNCLRNLGVPYGYNNGSQTAVITMPVTPTNTGNGQAFRFMIEVPLAYDPEKDLRGAMLLQSAVGESYLSIDWNSLLAAGANPNDDYVYNGAATSTVVQSAGTFFNINLFQEYLLPQTLPNGVTPIPKLDLLTVYEYNGVLKSSDNLAANQEKLLNYPNVRAVIGAYFNYSNNGVLNPATTDVLKVRQIANGNNILREWLGADMAFEQRIYGFDADLRNGTYWVRNANLPIQTAMYGNFQIGFTPSALSNANYASNIEIGFESFYTKGSTLPGLSQASG
jgi:hypothetical protein